jgi:ssDNA-binding Zn-finger/Zn-ribbon topoisomerase 1
MHFESWPEAVSVLSFLPKRTEGDFRAMHVPCPKCGKPADLQETKSNQHRVFKCRNKQCGESFVLPPRPPPPPPFGR